MTQAYLHAACVELAELLTAMLMKKTSCRLCCSLLAEVSRRERNFVAKTTYEDLKSY